MSESLLNYYNRFDPSKNYDRLMFRAGYVLQSAELNEIQSSMSDRVKGVADALFREGDVVRDAQISVNQSTGVAQCQSGIVYLRGAVRGVVPATLTIPVDRVVALGVYVIEQVITEVQDEGLRDPASEVRNYQEPGAGRLRISVLWGFDTDGQIGEFFPIYTVDFGVVRNKIIPPQLDVVSQAVARYDRDSTGGDYIVGGLVVTKLDDLNGNQQYSVSAGTARVSGFLTEVQTARRVSYAATPDILAIDSEPHLSTGPAAQRIDFDTSPAQDVSSVHITADKTVSLVHGSFLGVSDPLPDNSVLLLVSVVQGGTTYVQGTDYKLTAGKVDWSLGGAEPSPGSSYTVEYQYIAAVDATDVDATGCTVTGAVTGSLVLVSYNLQLPRIDRLCLSQDGGFVFVKGASSEYSPVAPEVPSNLLPVATITQTWTADTAMQNDGLRVISYQDLTVMNNRLDAIFDLVAQQTLKSDAGQRDAAAFKGVFVDPFLNDNQRDLGITQTASIVDGELTIPIAPIFLLPSADVNVPTSVAATLTPVLQQNAITGSVLINPYQAFAPIPAAMQLNPAVDRFTLTTETSAGTVIDRNRGGGSIFASTIAGAVKQVVSKSAEVAKFLRPVAVNFTLHGFAAGETLSSLLFDGVPVAAVASTGAGAPPPASVIDGAPVSVPLVTVQVPNTLKLKPIIGKTYVFDMTIPSDGLKHPLAFGYQQQVALTSIVTPSVFVTGSLHVSGTRGVLIADGYGGVPGGGITKTGFTLAVI